MMTKFSVTAACLAAMIGALAGQPFENMCYNPPDGTGRCGPNYNNAGCQPGQCCSEYEWCGSSPDHCNVNSICDAIDSDLESKVYLETEYSGSDDENYGGDDEMIRKTAPGAFNWCGRNKVVSLSFDDGPNTDGSTEAVLNDLKAFGIKASFYLAPFAAPLSESRDRDLQCSLVKQMINEGHEVYSHSLNHPDFRQISDFEMRSQIDNFNSWFKTCTNRAYPAPIQFRPPFGALKPSQRVVLNNWGLTVATWNIDTEDWTGISAKQVFSSSMEQFGEFLPGSSALILLHDHAYNETGSMGVIEMYYNAFRRMGYRFVAAKECYRLCALSNDCEYPKWPGVYN